ncbi:MAG: hypothetical protein SFZ24_08355, partial [Planctomycetota bacterium]|nr:hypothetical protein [Planctomycetota bacterium]
MTRVVPFALTLMAYGVSVLFVGGLTWAVAPPGASAVTALIIGAGACVLAVTCAVLALRIRSQRVAGMIGIHGGLALPLVIAIGPAMRLPSSFDGARAFNAAVREQPTIVSRESLADKSKPHPVAYQTVGLGGVGALSVFAFVALLAQRPRAEQRVEVREVVPAASAGPAG